MTKIVYNACFGGFSLSYAAVMRYAEIKGLKIYGYVDARKPDGSIDSKKHVPVDPARAKEAFCIHYSTSPDPAELNSSYFSSDDIERADPALVQVVEELGDKANGSCANLAIADIPSGTQYRIDEYDGNETVATRDSYDWQTA